MVGSKKANDQKEADDELAIKPVNPAVDNALGLALAALVLRLCWCLKDDAAIGLCFAVSLLVVILATKFSRNASIRVGEFLSSRRTSPHIPAKLRDPLKSKLQMRKFADQGWQLAIHSWFLLFVVPCLQQRHQAVWFCTA